MSFFRMFIALPRLTPRRSPGTRSDDLGGQVQDTHEAAAAQFAGDGAEDARATRVLLVVDQHHGVAVEADVTAVLAAGGLLEAHDHALDHVAFLDVAARDRLLDAGDD